MSRRVPAYSLALSLCCAMPLIGGCNGSEKQVADARALSMTGQTDLAGA